MGISEIAREIEDLDSQIEARRQEAKIAQAAVTSLEQAKLAAASRLMSAIGVTTSEKRPRQRQQPRRGVAGSILNAVRDGAHLVRDIAEKTGLDVNTVHTRCSLLKSDGRLARVAPATYVLANGHGA